MGMTPKAMGKTTLEEIEAMASRLEAAARTIRESLAVVQPQQQPLRVHAPRQNEPDMRPAPPPIQPGSVMLQTREREDFEAEREKRIAAMSEAQKERIAAQQAYLASVKAERDGHMKQFAHDGPANGVES